MMIVTEFMEGGSLDQFLKVRLISWLAKLGIWPPFVKCDSL